MATPKSTDDGRIGSDAPLGGSTGSGLGNELDDGRVTLGSSSSGSRYDSDDSKTNMDEKLTGRTPDSLRDSENRVLSGVAGGASGDGPGPQVMAADTLTGDDVVNAAGDNLGQVESIMLDVPGGRIAYAVLSFGGFLGMGDKLFAIPWNALKLDTENHCFVLNIDKEQLRNAPGFDKDHWPSMADQQWASQIHSYYGSRPYWD